MATFEQVQTALRREQAAKAAYDRLLEDIDDRFGGKGSNAKGVDARAGAANSPETREYDAASRELSRLQKEAGW